MIFILFFGIFLFVLTRGINLPYVGPYAFNFNTYSIIAHNYNQFGMLHITFAQVNARYASLPLHPEYYLHHPPLISIIESFLFKIFGEYFWVGRVTVILFAFASAILIYCIALQLKNRTYARLAFCVYTIIPASSIFGRMIGQEPLVLFFALLTLLLCLLYIKTKKQIYISLILLAVVLGFFSDWPMVYFVICLGPYLFYKKQSKLFFFIVLCSLLSVIGFLSYISIFQNGLHNLLSAFVTRSASWQVQPSYLWPLLWPAAILVRFFVYFNPIFASFSLLTITQLARRLYKKQCTAELFLYSGLFFFGLIHILLYPSGSFGHIYWIYYFIPFVCFASATVLMLIIKKPVILLAIFTVSGLFLLGVDKWKTGEVKGNLWRYQLDQEANVYLSPYEPVYINNDSSLDADIFHYLFLHSTKSVSPYLLTHSYRHYIYSCDTTCDVTNKDLQYLLSRYTYHKILSAQGEGYVFQLTKTASSSGIVEVKAPTTSRAQQHSSVQSPFLFRQVYILIVRALQVPFL